MNALVTGANGFVGRYLVHHLVDHGHSVTCLVHSSDSISWSEDPSRGLPKGVTPLQGDLLKPETYQESIEKTHFDWVFHLAAQSFVPEAFKNPKETYRVNYRGTRMLLESFINAQTPNPKFVIASTAEVYGGTTSEETRLKETDTRLPNNPYGLSKLCMEELCLDWTEEHELHIVIARSFPQIGPGQNDQFMAPAFAKQLALGEKSGKRELTLKVGDLTPFKDYTDVRDTVKALTLLAKRGVRGEIYNIASGAPRQVKEILDTLLSLSELSVKVEVDPERLRPTEARYLIGSSEKLKNLTGWAPSTPLKKSLLDLLEFYRKSHH